jgi:hypothetical protein
MLVRSVMAAHEIDDAADALAALRCLAQTPIDLRNGAGALGHGLADLLFGEAMAEADIHGRGPSIAIATYSQ